MALLGCGGRSALDWGADSATPGDSFHGGDPDAATGSDGSSTRPIDATTSDGGAEGGEAGTGPSDEPGSVASALQIDPAHDGTIEDPLLAGPLERLWSVGLTAQVSYPLIARGLVVVVASDGPGSQANLYAFHAHTGARAWGPTELGAGSIFGAATYEAGRVFTTDSSGTVRAFDLSSGKPLWATPLPNGQFYFETAPTAYGGIIYTEGNGQGGDGALFAVDEASGALLWQRYTEFFESDPAVTSDGVFVNHACDVVDRFDRSSGALTWSHSRPGCGGGGGWAPVVAGGLVYARQSDSLIDPSDPPFILDVATGTQRGTFRSVTPPAVHAGQAFVVHDGVLSAVDALGGTTAWTFKGDGQVITPPIVVGSRVFVGSQTGVLFGVDETTGSLLWSDVTGDKFSGMSGASMGVDISLGAASGLLAAPAGKTLVVYARAGRDGGAVDGGEGD